MFKLVVENCYVGIKLVVKILVFKLWVKCKLVCKWFIGFFGWIGWGICWVVCLLFWLFWLIGVVVCLIVVGVVVYIVIILLFVDDLIDGCVWGLVILLDVIGVLFVWCGDQFGGMIIVDMVLFYLCNVVVVIEDKCFYWYIGVSLCGIVSVVCINFQVGCGVLFGNGGFMIIQ